MGRLTRIVPAVVLTAATIIATAPAAEARAVIARQTTPTVRAGRVNFDLTIVATTALDRGYAEVELRIPTRPGVVGPIVYRHRRPGPVVRVTGSFPRTWVPAGPQTWQFVDTRDGRVTPVRVVVRP